MELFDHSKRSMEELLASDQYSPEELASLLDMPVNVIRTACHRGELKCRIVNHDIVSIQRNDALEWLQTRE
jgi:DNA-directed RNA polymerase specialized sigma24 family protein